ncbi:MAG: hypothetical protein ACI85O_001646 [Saprospiraceae bacterium]
MTKGITAIESYTGAISVDGDVLFEGDLTAWIRFANSLRVKYLMRISNKQDVAADLQAIYDSGNFIGENSQNSTFDFTDGQPNNFRMANLRAGDFNLFIMSKTIQDILFETNDTRVGTFFKKVQTMDSELEYQGFLNGLDASATSISIADYSLAGTIFREATGGLDANFMTAAETHFLFAEAAERDLITANPQTHYDTGVQASFDYWQTEMPADYLTSGTTAYGSEDKIRQIITQKWLHNIINGYEGWIEYRRTGFPELKTVAASLNNDLIPVRMPYPPDEQALNTMNYEAVTATNGNSVNTAVWWDN